MIVNLLLVAWAGGAAIRQGAQDSCDLLQKHPDAMVFLEYGTSNARRPTEQDMKDGPMSLALRPWKTGIVVIDVTWIEKSSCLNKKYPEWQGLGFPQYAYRFEGRKTVPLEVWRFVRLDAEHHLQDEDHEYFHPDVLAFMERIAKGVIPYGLRIEDQESPATTMQVCPPFEMPRSSWSFIMPAPRLSLPPNLIEGNTVYIIPN